MKQRFTEWCFTLNNATASEVHLLHDIISHYSEYPFARFIFGYEGWLTKTPHIQGCFRLYPHKAKTFRQVKSMFSGKLKRAHFEVVENWEHAYEYCKKEGDYYEIPFMDLPEFSPIPEGGKGGPSITTNTNLQNLIDPNIYYDL